jgi:hypothetical protein
MRRLRPVLPDISRGKVSGKAGGRKPESLEIELRTESQTGFEFPGVDQMEYLFPVACGKGRK